MVKRTLLALILAVTATAQTPKLKPGDCIDYNKSGKIVKVSCDVAPLAWMFVAADKPCPEHYHRSRDIREVCDHDSVSKAAQTPAPKPHTVISAMGTQQPIPPTAPQTSWTPTDCTKNPETCIALITTNPVHPDLTTADSYANGVHTYTIIDPDNHWRCLITSTTQAHPGNAIHTELSSFTLVCYDTKPAAQTGEKP